MADPAQDLEGGPDPAVLDDLWCRIHSGTDVETALDYLIAVASARPAIEGYQHRRQAYEHRVGKQWSAKKGPKKRRK